jgi:hypothetical protein
MACRPVSVVIIIIDIKFVLIFYNWEIKGALLICINMFGFNKKMHFHGTFSLILICYWGRLSLQQKWAPGAFPEGKIGRLLKADNLTAILCRCHVIWEP